MVEPAIAAVVHAGIDPCVRASHPRSASAGRLSALAGLRVGCDVDRVVCIRRYRLDGGPPPDHGAMGHLPRWTLQNRPFVDGSKPAISGGRDRVKVYRV